MITKAGTSRDELLRKIDAIQGVCESSKPGIRDLVAEITGIDLTPEPTYKIGQRFQLLWNGYDPRQYILAKIEDKVMAVNLKTGLARGVNRFTVGDTGAITRQELLRIFRTNYFDRLTLIN